MTSLRAPFQPRHGLIVLLIRWPLDILAFPYTAVLDCIKDKLPLRIAHNAFGSWLNRRTDRAWNETDLQGLVIELWGISWATISIMAMIVLSYVPHDPWWLRPIIAVPILLRLVDLIRVLIILNFYMSGEIQRSVARSYSLLILNFFEVGAIFASIHLLFYDFITQNNSAIGSGSLYFYSLTSMLTVDQTDFGIPVGASSCAFYVFKVVQPVFGVLFLAMAVSRIIDWKDKTRDAGNGA